MFVINYDIKSSDRTNAFMTKAKEYGEVETYIPNAMFLNTAYDRSFIYDQLRKELRDEDLLFITPIRSNEISGWLHSSSVDWISRHQF